VSSRRRFIASTLAAALLGGRASRAQPQVERHFLIGAGTIGGTYFPVAG
jgi:TRAP-type uncharacterized transport system substrate-binding protein